MASSDDAHAPERRHEPPPRLEERALSGVCRARTLGSSPGTDGRSVRRCGYQADPHDREGGKRARSSKSAGPDLPRSDDRSGPKRLEERASSRDPRPLALERHHDTDDDSLEDALLLHVSPGRIVHDQRRRFDERHTGSTATVSRRTRRSCCRKSRRSCSGGSSLVSSRARASSSRWRRSSAERRRDRERQVREPVSSSKRLSGSAEALASSSWARRASSAHAPEST